MLEARTALVEVHRRHALGRREQGQPGRAAARRGARAHGSARAPPSRTRATARRRSSRPSQTSDPKEKLAPHERTRCQEYKLAAHRLARVPEAGRERAATRTRAATSTPTRCTSRCASRSRCTSSTRRQYPEPTSQEIATAEQAAIDVRDSDEDDQFIDNAGLFVVDLADVDRDLAFQRWQDSSGTQGVEPRKDAEARGHRTATRRSCRGRSPDVIQKSMQARDEYVQRVPPERDKQNHVARLRVLRRGPVLPLRPLQGGRAALRGDLQGPLRQGRVRLRGVEAPHRHEQPAERTRALAASSPRPRRRTPCAEDGLRSRRTSAAT